MRGLTRRQPSVVSCIVCAPRGRPRSGFGDDPGRAAHRLDAAGEVEVALAELDRARGAS